MKTKKIPLSGVLLMAAMVSFAIFSSFKNLDVANKEIKSTSNFSKPFTLRTPFITPGYFLPGCVGTRSIGGVTYTFCGNYPTSNVVEIIYWSGGNTGSGNYGYFYINSVTTILSANVSFTGPSGTVNFNGALADCGN